MPDRQLYHGKPVFYVRDVMISLMRRLSGRHIPDLIQAILLQGLSAQKKMSLMDRVCLLYTSSLNERRLFYAIIKR